MPKFNKMKGFSLKSGNKPAFKQMGSGSPLDKALIGNQKNLPDHLRAKIEDAPGKMYNAPLKADDDDKVDPNAVVPEETEAEKKAREEKEKEEKKEPVKPRDSNMVMGQKFLANMVMGGMTESGMIKDKHSLAINYGPEKAEKEAEALTPGQDALKKSVKEKTQESRDAINKDLTGTFAEFTKEGKLIPADDPRHSSNITKNKSFQG